MTPKSAAGLTLLIVAFCAWLTLKQVPFLIPHRAVLWGYYLPAIGWFFGLLALHVYAACIVVPWLLLRRSTGDKLAIAERQYEERSR
jgi:hypothetical protein